MSSTFALSQLLDMETHEVPVILEWPVTLFRTGSTK